MNRLARLFGCLMLVAAMLASSLGTFGTALAAPENSRTDPITMGDEGQVGNYAITVLEVTPNANDIVAAENQYNDPPKDGNQFFIARIAVQYTGNDSGNPAYENGFKVVGESSVAYTTYDDGCGVVPEGLSDAPELFEGGKAEINLCWSVKSTDADSLEMFVEPSSGGKDHRVWFALFPDDGKATTTNKTPATASSETATTAGEEGTIFAVTTVDIKFDPLELTIPANTDVTITVTNKGMLQHDFAIEGEDIESALLNNGDSADVVVNLPAGTYKFICTVPGHKEAGMVGTLIVE